MKNRLWAVPALTLVLAVGAQGARKTDPELPPYTPTDKPDPATRHRTAQMAGADKIVFVKRQTYTSNHYYTEFINSAWKPGGNICVLDLTSGDAWDLVPELKDGVFERFDVNWEADKIVFAWKADTASGHRLYEVDIDPATGKQLGQLRQLTTPPANEKKLQELYTAKGYHHGTDDMHPCYLPDGDIVFISTRCQFGILCNKPDTYTTTVLYRRDRDTGALTKLTNSALSEASPVILDDGRIMYTRWEYVNKGTIAVKCLWAMKPDGSASAEIYGNTIATPVTKIYGRPIPGQTGQYVFLGTPHFPQNAMGTVIRLDGKQHIRSPDAMTLLTSDVTVRGQEGWHYSTSSEDKPWRYDESGLGRLFKEPYPLSMDAFLVSHKPAGPEWRTPNAYQLYLLNETGQVQPLYIDETISCFLPYPLKARKRPAVVTSPLDPKLAAKGQAVCMVTDIYLGMEGIERGAVKYIRVLEQVPRPWAARRRWHGDHYDQQHACITDETHLGLMVQHGVVPVETDGSAHFLVPAWKNVFFQALDENHMAVQTERTYVNYMPGETRACIGCHATPDDAATARATGTIAALKRAPSVPGPQPGETTGQRPLCYETDVQPVLDKHCVSCHSGDEPKGNLTLTGEHTKLFSKSYEQLLAPKPPKRALNHRSSGPILTGVLIGDNHPKGGHVTYLPPLSLGSRTSILAAMLAPDKVKLADAKQAKIAQHLAKEHAKIKLTPTELLRITNWIDTNAQYYGMYWGRRNIMYKDHPNYRPAPTFERAVAMKSILPEDER